MGVLIRGAFGVGVLIRGAFGVGVLIRGHLLLVYCTAVAFFSSWCPLNVD